MFMEKIMTKKTEKLFGVLFVASIFIFYTIILSISIINKNDSTKKNGSCNEIVDKLKEEMLELTKEKDKLKEVLQNQHHSL